MNVGSKVTYGLQATKLYVKFGKQTVLYFIHFSEQFRGFQQSLRLVEDTRKLKYLHYSK